jgi:hypothetical protein
LRTIIIGYLCFRVIWFSITFNSLKFVFHTEYLLKGRCS